MEMMIYLSKKWNINSQMGFIDVSIEFFIELKINSQSLHDIQDGFSVVELKTKDGLFIIEDRDWFEIQSELREIKINSIID